MGQGNLLFWLRPLILVDQFKQRKGLGLTNRAQAAWRWIATELANAHNGGRESVEHTMKEGASGREGERSGGGKGLLVSAL